MVVGASHRDVGEQRLRNKTATRQLFLQHPGARTPKDRSLGLAVADDFRGGLIPHVNDDTAQLVLFA